MLTQAGSETFWDRSTLYALRGVYACGETEKATDYLRSILPSVCWVNMSLCNRGMAGRQPAPSVCRKRFVLPYHYGRDVRHSSDRLNSFVFTPRLPQEWDHMNLRKICAFNQVFDIEVKRLGDQLQVAVIADGKTISNRKIKEGENIRIKF